MLASATSSAPSFTADLAGTYVASLTVNDGKVSSGASIVTVTASVANSAPVANAGSAQSVVAGANITLDGSLSSDANGDALNFSWTLVSRPAGSGAELSSSGSSRPTFVADLAGNYIVQLTVSDGQATSEIVSVTVTASTLNAAPVANAGNAQTVVAGSIVTIDGSRSSDANGDSLSYSWTLTSRPIGSAASLTSPTTVRPTFTADFAGTYVVSLTVSDGRLTSTASVATVTANIVNLGTLQYLGMNSSVENTNSDVVFHGDRAPTISSVSLAGRSCARDPARSSSTVAIFVCVTPAVTSGDERIDYLVVRSSDQPAAWNAGPIYTSSTVFWRNTNGELYLDSLGGYVYLGQGSSGAQIAFMPKSLSGNFGDINFPQLYSALRLGATICPKVVGVDWRYECPILPTGVYSVDLLFDNNSRYIVSQRYAVYISTVGTPTIPTVVNGLCGTNNGRAFSVLPTSAANLCASGGASAVSGNGPWSWTCIGSGLGASNSNCAAAYAPLTPGV